MRRARTKPVTGAKRPSNVVKIKTPKNVNINTNNPLQPRKKVV